VNPREAIEAAELAEHEIAYRNQLARQMYEAGRRDGYEAGRRDAEADMARFWAEAARQVTRGVSHAELEQRRWGPGGRAHFADPQPGRLPRPGEQTRTADRSRTGGRSKMTNTDQGRTPAVQPEDPAMQTGDPGMFAPLTTDENGILGAHLTSGWYKQAAVYPTLSEPWKETAAVLDDLHIAFGVAMKTRHGPANAAMTEPATEPEPEAGQ
jgi:hypothetical protein